MSRIRIVIGAAGVVLGLFGVFRLLTQISAYNLLVLTCWLIGALIIHDGLISPLIVGFGAVLNRVVPTRARRFLQAALIASALVTVIALPMIYRQDSQPRVKAILQQHFGANLATLLAIVAGGAVLLYAAQLMRDRRHPASAVNDEAGHAPTPSTD